MAAIMADEEDGMKMDDRLIILKESLSVCRRAAAFGKLSMLEVFVTTGDAFSMLHRLLKPVKRFSLVDSCRLPPSKTWSTINIALLGGELSGRRWWRCPNIWFSILIHPFLSSYILKGDVRFAAFPFIFLFRSFVHEV